MPDKFGCETAAEIHERKKREEAERWKKVLLYYMFQQYQEEKERLEKMYSSVAWESFGTLVDRIVERLDPISKLFERKPNSLSIFDRLEKIAEYEEKDSPFLDLYHSAKDDPPQPEKIKKSWGRCLKKAPEYMIARERNEQKRRRGHRIDRNNLDKEGKKYEVLLSWRLSIIRDQNVELFNALCKAYEAEGRLIDPNMDFSKLPEIEAEKQAMKEHRGKFTYEEYIDNVRDKESSIKDLKAAAYIFAAYEQKTAPEFDAEKADRRAGNIFCSRAFTEIGNEHPAELLTMMRDEESLKAAYDKFAKMEKEYTRRDAVLSDASELLSRHASGRTKRFHRMFNALNSFVKAENEPPQETRQELAQQLSAFVLTDCAPESKEYSKACFTQAMRCLRVLVSEKKFADYVDSLNRGNYTGKPISVDDFSLVPAQKKSVEVEKTAPERVLVNSGSN